MFFSLFGILCAFLRHFISFGPSLQFLDFPLIFILPVQICRYADNITLVGSNVNVITDTCTSSKDSSTLNARLS